ncbi:hypothetical protein ABB37_06996 [Leptomonas pyrrhocoris]|uniref:Uncharacterized protein n=1 Tax=Leptomonas pyrrhocoris TaxID=157538 RepID=A0A0N0DTL2_LEPPY|nr:hypothetical protein ABB37_06996 [Leptomonas pyrrhocoris]KPA77641.1 hypothetical protein ABB37_06996 [Leptomonas pyrrhocoris]|eukprot:XP_015656080.1 hypothetical protein ABB37_06996 [Leptomonas pyrrhocoris]
MMEASIIIIVSFLIYTFLCVPVKGEKGGAQTLRAMNLSLPEVLDHFSFLKCFLLVFVALSCASMSRYYYYWCYSLHLSRRFPLLLCVCVWGGRGERGVQRSHGSASTPSCRSCAFRIFFSPFSSLQYFSGLVVVAVSFICPRFFRWSRNACPSKTAAASSSFCRSCRCPIFSHCGVHAGVSATRLWGKAYRSKRETRQHTFCGGGGHGGTPHAVEGREGGTSSSWKGEWQHEMQAEKRSEPAKQH